MDFRLRDAELQQGSGRGVGDGDIILVIKPIDKPFDLVVDEVGEGSRVRNLLPQADPYFMNGQHEGNFRDFGDEPCGKRGGERRGVDDVRRFRKPQEFRNGLERKNITAAKGRYPIDFHTVADFVLQRSGDFLREDPHMESRTGEAFGQAREEDLRPAEMGVVVVQAEQDVAWRRGWHCKRQKGLKGRKRRRQPFAKEALSLEP